MFTKQTYVICCCVPILTSLNYLLVRSAEVNVLFRVATDLAERNFWFFITKFLRKLNQKTLQKTWKILIYFINSSKLWKVCVAKAKFLVKINFSVKSMFNLNFSSFIQKPTFFPDHGFFFVFSNFSRFPDSVATLGVSFKSLLFDARLTKCQFSRWSN